MIEEPKETELFGFYFFEPDMEAVYIKGNAAGLRRFANQLILKANEFDTNKDIAITPSSYDNFSWVQGDIAIFRIEEINETKEVVTYKETVSDKIKNTVFTVGCISLLFIILLCAFAGMQTIYNWFF